MSKVKELMEKRNDVLLKMTAIIDKAEEEVRAMSETEQQDYEKYKKELEALNATITAAEERARREAGKNPKTQEEKNEEEEIRAFEKYCRGETRALKLGDNGSIMPRTVVEKIITKVKETCPIFELADLYNINGELVVPYYDETSSAITAAYIEEFSDLVEKSGDLKSYTLKSHIIGALAKVSKKLINNTDFDIVGFVVNQIVKSLREMIEKEALTGESGKIKGIFPNAKNKVTAEDATITGDLLIDVQMSVKEPYQEKAIWIMDRSTLREIRKLKDGDGNYLMIRDFATGGGWMLLNKKVYLSENAQKFAASTKVLAYGDMKGYTLKIGKDIETQILQEKYSSQYAVGIEAFVEADGAITNEEAIAVLEMGAGA
ncbi:phage major capsid protein [Anaerotignum sp.]|uniref:phage major capsid protein n=1 Tax=Anaerotignum sp. TaxID=2039241 RepID=UPI003A8AEB25